MTDQIKEQISALLDGELPEDELDLLVRRMERDAGLRLTFGRYALVGEALRAPGGAIASAGFAQRVSLAIADPGAAPPSAAVASAPLPRRWARPVAGAAVAAGAVLAAVLLVRPDGGEPIRQARTLDAPASTAAGSRAVDVDSGAASPTPARSQRMAAYLVAHGEYATPIGRRNIWTGVLANDPGITRVSYEFSEAR